MIPPPALGGDAKERVTVDCRDWPEVVEKNGWSDGYPVFLPETSAVSLLLAEIDAEYWDTIAWPENFEPIRAGPAAANAVMAGCDRLDFPVVVAAVQAMCQPDFNLGAVLSSTGGASLCVILSGPIVEETGYKTGSGVLGVSTRRNVAVGRTLRLVALNLLGARPGAGDFTSIGNPARYSLFVPEIPSANGWPTAFEEWSAAHDVVEGVRGLVGVVATEGPHQVANHTALSGRDILSTYASAMRNPATFAVGKGGMEGVVIVGPDHTEVLVRERWSKDDVRRFLAKESAISIEELKRSGIVNGPAGSVHDLNPSEAGLCTTISDPRDVLLVSAGGWGSGWGAYLPGFFAKRNGRSCWEVI